ncbi:MAG: prepilin-type N-terminal cleavage/methylation domain-containing protein [Pseudomonadota bacterium]
MYRRAMRSVQRGFTLLELLVVVAILAAIAGTATIALQDTDARAAAAAHVAMMDELNKGIRTYRVLNGNELPNDWDSLLFTAVGDGSDAALLPSADGEVLGTGDLAPFVLNDDMMAALEAIGMTNLRIVDGSAASLPPDAIAGVEDCQVANIQALINSRRNAVVAGNIYLSNAANGCGIDYSIADPNPAAAGDTATVAVWAGGQERVLGTGAAELTAGADPTLPASWEDGGKVMMAVGAGPSSNLFDASELGGLTSVPVYRHVAQDQYNRFIILFHVATAVDSTGAGGAADTIVSVDQVALAGVIDGAGDTKEEELGEWDGTRNTI